MAELSNQVRVGDICDFAKGKKPEEISDVWREGDIPYILIESFTGPPSKFTKSVNLPRCFREDVLMVMDGASSGLVATGIEGAIGSTLAAVRPKKSTLFPRYLYFWLKSKYNLLNQRTKGAAIPHVDKKLLQDLLMPIPELETQKRIVSILDIAEKVLQQREAANQIIATTMNSVFLKMFGDPLSNENHWPVKTIREVAEKISDGPFGSNLKTEHYTADGVRVIRLQNIGVGEFLDDDKVFISLEHYSKLKKHTCLPGDVIVGTLGDPNLRACILPDYVKVAINKADCIQVRPNKSFVNAAYLCHLLNTPQMLRLASSYIHGETRTRISMSQVASLQIPIPPLSVQEEYAKTVRHFDHAYANQKRSSEVIDELFHSLMHKAFGGELDLANIKTRED